MVCLAQFVVCSQWLGTSHFFDLIWSWKPGLIWLYFCVFFSGCTILNNSYATCGSSDQFDMCTRTIPDCPVGAQPCPIEEYSCKVTTRNNTINCKDRINFFQFSLYSMLATCTKNMDSATNLHLTLTWNMCLSLNKLSKHLWIVVRYIKYASRLVVYDLHDHDFFSQTTSCYSGDCEERAKCEKRRCHRCFISSWWIWCYQHETKWSASLLPI